MFHFLKLQFLIKQNVNECPFTYQFMLCSLLCLPAVCWTSCWHYFSCFHKGVLTTASLCSLYTKCAAQKIPFGPVVSWNKPSATAPLSTCPGKRGQAQKKWIHILYGPQQRVHLFCHPALGRITSTQNTFLWVPLIAISNSSSICSRSRKRRNIQDFLVMFSFLFSPFFSFFPREMETQSPHWVDREVIASPTLVVGSVGISIKPLKLVGH